MRRVIAFTALLMGCASTATTYQISWEAGRQAGCEIGSLSEETARSAAEDSLASVHVQAAEQGFREGLVVGLTGEGCK